jgi:hypothetical protein
MFPPLQLVLPEFNASMTHHALGVLCPPSTAQTRDALKHSFDSSDIRDSVAAAERT